MIAVRPDVLGVLLFAFILGVCGLWWAFAVALWKLAVRLGWAR